MAEPHVLSALVEKRSRLLGEVLNRRFQILRLENEIQHIDAVIRMFKPGYDVEAILPKVTYRKRASGTAKGAGIRDAYTVLREAGLPLEAREIARRVLDRLGKPKTVEAVNLLASTIHSVLGRRKDGSVVFDASTYPGTWRLVSSQPSLDASASPLEGDGNNSSGAGSSFL